MFNRLNAALLGAALALAVTAPVGASPGVDPVEPLTPVPAPAVDARDDTGSLWFVEMPSPPTAEGTALATVRSEKAAFRAGARKAGLRYTERYAFDRLWNGLSIRIDRSQLAALQRVQGVQGVYPVATIAAPVTTPSERDLYTALSMTGADVAQSELGYTGSGVQVGVMDTGIDVDHPAFGGDGVARFDSGLFPSARVPFGYDFVGDDYNADETSPSYNPVPIPDPNPDDCAGHGTHVAGIVGANDATIPLRGVAPAVTFGAYRVFGCQGSTTSDVMIAAMERALADGMDVLNMSIGSAYQWPKYPTAVAATRLVNKGVVVVASIGNNGPNGLYAAGAPGIGDKVIGVASFDNSNVALSTFTISPDNAAIGYANATGAPPAPTSGTLPMARTGAPSKPDDACAPLSEGSLAGHVALIRRGTCTFYAKAYNAMQAGAVAVVLYNNSPGRFSPNVAGDPAITIPVVAISDTEGVQINNRIAAGPVDLTWTDQTGSFPNPTGGLISSFSSYGLSPDLALKADLGAPGGSIYSSYPLELGGYATLSGTSMAAPHVAGAVALLLQAKPRTSPQAVRTILQNSADPAAWWGNPGLGYLDNVHRQGAGMLDIDDAILSTTTVDPGKLSLGESESGPATRTLEITNTADAPVTYDLGSAQALSTGGVITPSFFASDAAVAFSVPSVTVPAHGKARVDLTITPPTGPAKGQYGGYLVLTPQGGGQVHRVPFAGFVGDYQSIEALTPAGVGLPLLARASGASFEIVPPGATFTLAEGDIPYVLAHLDHQVDTLKIEVFAAASGKAWHRAYEERYVARNSTTTSFFAFPFDGRTTAGSKILTVPDGTYVLKASVLKAMGDKANASHWETWTSPQFVIDRP
jgi:subtilisin family serine protease